MKDNMNFLPEDYLAKKAQQRTNLVCLVLFIVVLSAVAAAWFITETRRRTMLNEQQQMAQQMALASESLKKLDELEKKRKMMEEKAQLSAMLTESVPRSLLLATITNNLPDGVSLVGYKLQSKEIKQSAPVKKTEDKAKVSYAARKQAKTEPKVEAVKFETDISFVGLAGNDLEVAKMIEDLGKSHLMNNITLKYTEDFQKDQVTYKRFEVEAVLSPGVRASEDDVMWARSQHIKSY